MCQHLTAPAWVIPIFPDCVRITPRYPTVRDMWGVTVSLSVTDPINPAFDRTKRILFQPFDSGKWLRLGFCAFLMGLAEGGGGGGGGGFPSSGGSGGGGGPDFEPVMQWIRDNLTVIVVVAVAVLLAVFVISLVLTWLGSRGRFMFLDGVVHNRGAVVAPWHEYRREGNSLFLFRFCLGMIALLVVVLILGLCALIAWPDIQGRHFGGFAVGAILTGIVMFLAFGLTMSVISVFLKDFIVPIMYLRRITVMAGWREFSSSMLAGNTGLFVLYFLMKIVLGLAVGVLALMTTCLTCCIAVIPYIGSVILLPLTVFLQAYPLYFIEQFGPSWHIFPPDKPPTVMDSTTPFADGSL